MDGELASGSENLDGSSEGLRTSANGNDDFSSKEGKHVSRVPPVWLADAIPNDFTVSSSGSGNVIPLYMSPDCFRFVSYPKR